MAIDEDTKWLVNVSFISLTFVLAFSWRLWLKLGRSDKAIAVNYGRLQAQKIGILQRSWQGKKKTTELNESDLVKLTKNAQRIKDAIHLIDTGGPYNCPWGASCPFQSTNMYDMAPLEYLTGSTFSNDSELATNSLVPDYTKLQAALEFIRELKYGNYRTISTPMDVQKYLLRIHVEAAAAYAENTIMNTAAKRIPHAQQKQFVLSVAENDSDTKELRF